MANEEYLGDGLYASDEGHQIALKANHHEYPSDVVYLDSYVFTAFINWVKRVHPEWLDTQSTPEQATPLLSTFNQYTTLRDIDNMTLGTFYAMLRAQLEKDEQQALKASWPTLGTQP